MEGNGVLSLGTMGYVAFIFVLSLVFDYLPVRGVPGLVFLFFWSIYVCLLPSHAGCA